MDMIKRVEQAIAEVKVSDDEGEYPPLCDLIEFSGENKFRTVVTAIAIAAMRAMREPTAEMEKAGDAWTEPTCGSLHPYTAMIDTALGEHK